MKRSSARSRANQPAPAAAALPLLATRRGTLVAAALALCGLGVGRPAVAQSGKNTLTVAAASDLRFALDELLQTLRTQQPGLAVEVVYGSSGKLSTQLLNGAPFDLFFSADRGFAQVLFDAGLCTQAPVVYALGHLVAASRSAEMARLPLRELVQQPAVKRFAIANPLHAPYGQRAREALQHQGLWAAVEPRLVMGDNVAQAAQFIDTGAAQAGLVARALVLAPALQGRLAWQAIPPAWHSPLEQAWVLMKRSGSAAQQQAAQLLALMQSPAGQALMQRYGFEAPGAAQR